MEFDQLPTGRPIIGERRSIGQLPQAERLGVGVVGLHEGSTLLVALRTTGYCRAVAGCDLSEAKRKAAQKLAPSLALYSDFEQLLGNSEVRIVAIYTPDHLHAEQIKQAMEAGKDVLCTKPLLNDPSEIESVWQVAQRTGRRLQVGQSTRFYEPFQRQRERFESGDHGEIEVVDAHYHHRMDWYYDKSPWTIDTTHWAYLGLSHPVDLVRWYLGEIETVHAIGTTTELGRTYGVKTPDAICVNLQSENGRIASVAGNYGFHELPRARALIECFLMGSKGSSLARYPDLRFTYHDARGVEIEEDYHHALAGYYYRHELKGMHYGEFANYADHFAKAIVEGMPNSPNLAEGLQTVLVMRAIVTSLEIGSVVRVPKLAELIASASSNGT